MPNKRDSESGSGGRKVAKQGLATEVDTSPIFNAFLASTGDRELASAATDLISELAGDKVVERLASRLDAIGSAIEAVRVIATELGRAAAEIGVSGEASRAASDEAQAKNLERVRNALLKMMESLYRLVESLRQDLGKHGNSRDVILEAQGRAIELLRETVSHLRADMKAQGVAIQELKEQGEAFRQEVREAFDRRRKEREADRREWKQERQADLQEWEQRREADRREWDQRLEADRRERQKDREADRRERKIVLTVVGLMFSVTIGLAIVFLQWAYPDRDTLPTHGTEQGSAEVQIGPQSAESEAEAPSSQGSGEDAGGQN